MFYHLVIVLLCSLSSTLFSIDSQIDPSPMAIFNSEPSAFVGNVNVITGTYHESSQDVVIPGPEPLIIQRAYSSGTNDELSLLNGWSLNHVGEFRRGNEDRSEAQLKGLFGSPMIFKESKSKDNKYYPDTENLIDGYSNTSEGMISGRTNKKNDRIIFEPKHKTCELITGSGEKKTYSRIRYKGEKTKQCVIRQNIKPNGNQIHYFYNDERAAINKILVKSASKDFSWAHINWLSPSEFRKNHDLNIITNDNRTINYRFKRIPIDKKHNRYFLTHVTRSHGLDESYEYDFGGKEIREVVTKKIMPGGNFLETEYYDKGSNKAGPKWTKVKSRDSKLFRRVKNQKAPVGNDNKAIIIHSFDYRYKDNKTIVYDAYQRPTEYHFSDNSILTKIQKGTKLGNAGRIEEFFWGSDDSLNQGNLLSHTVVTWDGNKGGLPRTATCKSFAYDKKGNVIWEALYGNLTGKFQGYVDMNPLTRYPKNNGCESYEIEYKYSKDGFNLLLEETYPNGKTISYSYKPNTDLLIAKLIREKPNGTILSREFYNFNNDAVLIETIRDNGNTEDVNNISSVTERHITTIIPKEERPCIGVPVVIIEKCLDLTNQNNPQEILLKKIENDYDTFGNIIQQRHFDNTGNLAYTLYWEFNRLGFCTLEIDALGNRKELKYNDSTGLLEYEKGAKVGGIKTYTYDFANRLIKEEMQDSSSSIQSNSYEYDYMGNKKSSTNSQGNKTIYKYNEFYQLVEVTLPKVRNHAGEEITPTTRYTYDLLGNCTSVTNGRDITIKKKFNARGKPIRITYPDNTTEYFEYTLDGKIAQTIDRKGVSTIYTYDLFDRVTTEKKCLGDQELSCKSNIYSTFNLLKEIDELGHETTYDYDSAGRLIKKTCGNQLTTYEYDSLGRQNKICEWNSPTTYVAKWTSYNCLNQVLEEKTIDQDDNVYHHVKYSYTPTGERESVTTFSEAGTSTTTTTFNAFKEPVVVSDAEKNNTVYSYNYKFKNSIDQFVLQTTITDSQGINTITTYDALNRPVIVCKQDPMGVTLQKQELYYDEIGNKRKWIDTVYYNQKEEKKLIYTASYNAMNLLETQVEGVGTNEEKRTTFSYNELGEKEKIIKPNGDQILHAYDSQGRLISYKANDQSFNYSYEYNKKGVMTKAINEITQLTTERTYDQNNLMSKEKLENGLTIDYSYDRVGRPVKLILPDSSGIAYEYKGPYLSKAIRLNHSSIPQYSHQYSQRDLSGHLIVEQLVADAGHQTHRYDLIGRIKSTISPQWQETDLVYQGLHRLLERKIKDNSKEIACTYDYDKLDQLIDEKGVSTHQYQYDSLNNMRQIDQVDAQVNTHNQLLKIGSQTYSYDSNGNRKTKETSHGIINYKYDALDRLISVTQDKEEVSFSYDAFNRRMTKTGNESTVKYLYADQNEIASFIDNKMSEFRLLGTGKSGDIGAAVAIELKDQLYVPLHDHSGHVTCLLDKNGQVVENYTYSAFGQEQITDQKGNKITKSINPWRFSSKRIDPETNLIYFGRRYYDPEVGRWITADPIGQEGGPNLYAYVLNNPLMRADLLGLFGFDDIAQGFTQICNFIGTSMQFVGNGISSLGNNLIPVPVIKDAVMCLGHMVAGNSINTYIPSWRQQHSTSGATGDWYSPDRRDIIINGMGNDKKELELRSSKSSQGCNSKRFDNVHNANHGLTADILEWSCQRLGIQTNSVNVLVKDIRQKIEDMGGIGNGGCVGLWAHSQAGEMVANLSNYLSKEEMSMIEVTTFGSANLFSKLNFAKVQHYVSTRDWIPLITNPFQYLKACLGGMPEVTFLPAIGNSWFDHGMDNRTYWTQFEKCTHHFR